VAALAVAAAAAIHVGPRAAESGHGDTLATSSLEASAGPARPLAAVLVGNTSAFEQQVMRSAKTLLPFVLAPLTFIVAAARSRSAPAPRRGDRGTPAGLSRRHSIVLRAPPFSAPV
jgi:hypothetical protein